MNIPAVLWEFLRSYLLSEGLNALLTSDFMINVYFFLVLFGLGIAWKKWRWFRLLGSLYVEYYQWAEQNVALPGNYKLRKYMEKLNQRILELRGRPMTEKEIKRAKLAADALAEKDHLKKAG